MLKTFLDMIRADHDPLSEGLRMDKTTYQSLISDPEFRAGFEAEFHMMLPYRSQWDENPQEVEDDYTDQFYDVLSNLERELGQRVIPNPEADRHKDGQNFYLDIEHSLDSLYGDRGMSDIDDIEMGLELVSPPLPLDEFMEYLISSLDWIDGNAMTSEYTGLHISVSYGDRPASTFNALKVLLLMGEEELLQRYGREYNPNTQSHLEDLMRRAHRLSFQDFTSRAEDIGQVENYLNSQILRDKHFTMNYGKFLDQGYMEFRVTGGQDYSARISEIRRQVMQYALLMKAGYDPKLYRREYLLKLYKFLQRLSETRQARLGSMEPQGYPRTPQRLP